MRFETRLVLALAILAAITVVLVDQASYRTVTVVFSSPSRPAIEIPAPPILPSSPDDDVQVPAVEVGPRPTSYFLRFEATAGAERLEGSVTGRFGYNALLERTVGVDDLSTLSGKTVTIRYRHRALPWASATSARAEISKHFDALILDGEWKPPQHPNTWVFAY